MDYKRKIFREKVAIGIIFKKLRTAIIIDEKPMTQGYLNNDIHEKFDKTWNSGREESLPNTTLENLLLMCDYFKLKPTEFFKLVDAVSEKEITKAIQSKEKLSKAYRSIG